MPKLRLAQVVRGVCSSGSRLSCPHKSSITIQRRARVTMFSSFRLPLFTFRSSNSEATVNTAFPAVPVYDVETSTDRRSRTVKHLLKANHTNHSIVFNNMTFHNHVPHIVGLRVPVGAPVEQLHAVYESESQSLEPYTDSPGEISLEDWRDYLGKPEYSRAWVDFFEDQLAACAYDWRAVVKRFLLDDAHGTADPLLNSLICGLGHPMIHLGYAYELNSHSVAVEGLALAAVFHDDTLHKYIEDPLFLRPSSQPITDSVLTVIERIRADPIFDTLCLQHPGAANLKPILASAPVMAALVDHWNAWTPQKAADTNSQVASTQEHLTATASALLIGSVPLGERHTGLDFDFFLLHLLTTTHAMRILLPVLPIDYHANLQRQWVFFALLVYIAQLRPRIDVDVNIIAYVPPEGRSSWEFVASMAREGSHATDAHYIKGLRALANAQETWGDRDGWWRKAACRLANEFAAWGGFGA